MYITNNPHVAAIAQKYGTDYIFVDLETLGKEERQKGMNTVKSHHKIADIPNIKNVLTTSKLLVRVNPINPNSRDEINAVIDAGADIIMLPMWKTVNDVELFLKYIDGRTQNMLLLETKEANECLDNVLEINGINSVHIGLNDLHLSYNLDFMFEPLANGMVDGIANKLKAHNIPFGFGGIAQIGTGTLPAEKIVMEHHRIGSSMVILSRSFCDTTIYKNLSEIEDIFSVNIKKLRDFEDKISILPTSAFDENRREVAECIDKIVEKLKNK